MLAYMYADLNNYSRADTDSIKESIDNTLISVLLIIL